MELALTLDRYSDLPLHRQVYEELRRAILTGRLLPCQRVPSTRSLAQSLKISRATVTQSYDQLLSEGYLETRQGAGTFVCAQLPDPLPWTETIAPSPCSSPLPPLSAYGTRLSTTAFALQPDPATEITFRYSRPALAHFPMRLWRKLLSEQCRADLSWLDYVSDPQGYLPLRQAIAYYLSRTRAVQCQPEQIVLTNGTQQALALVLRLLIEPGEAIALENPGYLSARRIFASHGARLVPIPVDASGLQVAQLTQVNLPIRLVYVTPSHQFPTGAILSLARRLELLAWAQQSGALILEDDYDSEYRYGEQPIPALQGLQTSGVVLYLGTFSKVLFPSLRIGYLVLPSSLVSLVAQAKWFSDRQLPTLEQRVLTEFITAGHLESHIRKMRSHYDRSRQVLVQALQTHFGDQATILGEKAGLHLMVRFASHSAEVIQQKATSVGVGLMSAAPHYLEAPSPDPQKAEFILGYGDLEERAIEEGIRRLAQVLK
ncbi:PLP-dependent aminotransferase family protein [Phormidium tenue FACHB-886]|nr:PLP-dependent aminotransferase family protein [Phormidium tenue FACHB-886]